jgi:hypothetical protein
LGDGVDERIKVESREVRILCLYKYDIGSVVPEEEKMKMVRT